MSPIRLLNLSLVLSAALHLTGCQSNPSSTAAPAASAQTKPSSQAASAAPATPSASPSQAAPFPSPSTGGAAQLIHSEQSGAYGWFIYSENNGSKLNVYTTRNNGQTWSAAPLPIQANWEREVQKESVFTSFHSPELQIQDSILLTSGPGLGLMEKTLYRSAENGTWFFVGSLTNQIDGYVTGLVFPDQKTGFISASYHGNTPVPFYRTTDEGKTWQPVSIPLPQGFSYGNVSRPSFTSSKKGTVTIEFANESQKKTMIYSTQDGGSTWTAS